MKHCILCKYYARYELAGLGELCTHDKSLIPDHNPIRPIVEYRTCLAMRAEGLQFSGGCGLSGRLFEEKPPPEIPQTKLSKIFNFFKGTK